MPTPKWIVGTPVACQSIEDAPRVRQGELAVVPAAERAGPGIEDLDGLRARLDLREQRSRP